MVYEKGKILGSYSINNGRNSMSGYVDGTKMYKDIITQNRANYTYSVSNNLIGFGN